MSSSAKFPEARSVSVVVPVCEVDENLRHCLASLRRCSPAPDEVIVVVDGSTSADGGFSGQLAREYDAQLLILEQNGGPAKARNAGVLLAQSELIFFVDADVEVAPDAIGVIQGTFIEDDSLAALIGSYDDAPAAPNFLSQYKNLLHHWTHQTASEEATTFWGACGAIRKEVFASVGGFDENYERPSIEDIELGSRLVRAGHRIRLCKDLQVKHRKRYDAVSLVKSDFCDRAVPWTELMLSDGQLNNDLNLKNSSRASTLLMYALVASSVAAPRSRAARGVALFCALALLILNAPLYSFFAKKRGGGFAVKSVPWHWLYFLYSGGGFAVGAKRHFVKHWKPPKSDS